jgi:hypothetical protein
MNDKFTKTLNCFGNYKENEECKNCIYCGFCQMQKHMKKRKFIKLKLLENKNFREM